MPHIASIEHWVLISFKHLPFLFYTNFWVCFHFLSNSLHNFLFLNLLFVSNCFYGSGGSFIMLVLLLNILVSIVLVNIIVFTTLIMFILCFNYLFIITFVVDNLYFVSWLHTLCHLIYMVTLIFVRVSEVL
jgi:hypothetical protein